VTGGSHSHLPKTLFGATEDSNKEEVRARLQQVFGPRGQLIAAKARGKQGITRSTDEEVVYVAIAHALRSGQPTAILTKDEDIQEQFYKLVWLIDTHYRGFLFAR
jgi:hypothetical protein